MAQPQRLMAEVEFDRLQGASAWTAVHHITGIMRNQYSARYIFEDGSRLYIYFNGAATCERAAADVLKYREHWHNCTK